MAKPKDMNTTPLGVYPERDRPAVTAIELSAAAISLFWLALSGGFFLFAGIEGEAGLRFLLTIMVIFLPVAMVWVAAMAMRATRVMRNEAKRLEVAVDALRRAYVAQSRDASKETGATIAKKLDEIAATQKKAETALAMFVSTRARESATPARVVVADPGGTGGDQPTLELGTPSEALVPPLANGDFIRALNFPDTAEDEAGFAALRRALKHRPAAQLVQASQDVLTLLSQDGIYMDDLRPDMARPELWRRFAQGERGRTIAALGGVRDRSSLALTSARIKEDAIFRDAAHHFLRLFDKGLARFEPEASDTEISDLANTRTARAFMLLGRVAGTFD
ncbi:hypothetical protein FIU97_16030 [Roseivivax sp. THAF40]|uniref:hypothetical protein n=1 Tax=unclassified Roseivivax TaxID=2639302 RepID=UPI00126848E7|nr:MULTISPECIES: hypothetical protein [unclassified Roseivivax]QFS84263.1 hypothetical protein FIV09_15615 [Roseivivax sp. THAF197b]QFT48091.1 hypothetical protein FIU97_16030 [Roseivivax sp. THAF40]